jgi:hypothetical protein
LYLIGSKQNTALMSNFNLSTPSGTLLGLAGWLKCNMNIQLAITFTKVGERQQIRSTPRGSLKLIANFHKKESSCPNSQTIVNEINK